MAAGKGKQLAKRLGLPEPDHEETRNGFRHRCLALALEAYRREEISRGKFVELAMMLGPGRDEFDRLLEDAGLGNEPPGERGGT
jgi:hypothetical protein